MNILFCVSSMHGGGAERVAATLSNAWAAAGHHVTLVATYSGRGECLYTLDPRVQLCWLADRLPGKGPAPWRAWRKLAALRALVRETRPDVVVSFLTNVNVNVLLATRGLGVPVVVSERTNPASSTNVEPALAWLRRLLYRCADVVVSQTDVARDALHALVPGIRHSAVVPNPLPSALLDDIALHRGGEAESSVSAAQWSDSSVQASHDLESQPQPQASLMPVLPQSDGTGRRYQLVAMGRLAPVKRFDWLLVAFARLAQRHPDWDLIIHGDGPLRQPLLNQAASAGLAQRVLLPGRTDVPWQALREADLFALTSRAEGFPNAMLEAMAIGLPCVAVDCPSGPAELSRQGQDARLVGRDDMDAFVAQLDTLMSDAAARAELGRAGAASVRERFSPQAVLALWDAVLAQALARRGANNAVSAQPAAWQVDPSAEGQAGATGVVPEPPLHVVHVISGLGQGGAEAVLFRLVTAPGQRTHHTVISLGELGHYGPPLQAAGVTVQALGMRGVLTGMVGFWRLVRRLRALRPDAVQTWMYDGDLFGGLAARLAGIRAVAWGIRNSGASLGASSRRARILAWCCARVSHRVPAAIVACAQEAAERHQAWGYDAARMRVIVNGYDLSRWRPDAAARERVRAELGLSSDTVLIGCVARWNPLKDHGNLFAALVQLRQHCRPDAGAAGDTSSVADLRCVLIGHGMTSDNTALVNLLDQYGLRDWVLLLGSRENVPDWMNAMDLHVLPSLAEGFPNVLAEAMACGVPCVTTDVGDAARIAGDEAWVVPARDPVALAGAMQAVLRLRGTPALAERVARGRERVADSFGLETMMQAYDALWRSMADSAGLPASTVLRPRRLMFVVNNPAFFLSHRLPLALAARQDGFEVHVATPDAPSVAQVRAHGFTHHVVAMSRSGKNPLGELSTLRVLYRLFRAVQPDIVHGVTIKPVLYGGIAARLARVPGYVAAVSGLGFVFMRQDVAGRLVRQVAVMLYRQALGHPNSRVIFQNTSDRDVLERAHAVRREQVVMIRGSGVDLSEYCPQPEPSGPPVVVMAARLLADKGVREFVQAARLTRGDPSGLRWVLAGSPDPGNPASIPQAELQGWREEGIVDIVGEQPDIDALYAGAHIVALPSYREGLPKSLVEAAACGRAVVTTDVPGCRDAMTPDETGLLVPVRDARALADAVVRLAQDDALRQRMGHAGRALAEQAFDIRLIARQHLDIYAALLDGRRDAAS